MRFPSFASQVPPFLHGFGSQGFGGGTAVGTGTIISKLKIIFYSKTIFHLRRAHAHVRELNHRRF